MDSVESLEEPTALRCRRCRKCLIESTCLLSIADASEAASTCSVWHVDVDLLPDWILAAIDKVQWTVGKLSCHHCGARLGGFNFINCPKCPCGNDAHVHLSKSRVDHDLRRSLHMARPVRMSRQFNRLDPNREHVTTQTESLEGDASANIRHDLTSGPHMLQDQAQQDIQFTLAEMTVSSSFTHLPHTLSPEAEEEAYQQITPHGGIDTMTGEVSIQAMQRSVDSNEQEDQLELSAGYPQLREEWAFDHVSHRGRNSPDMDFEQDGILRMTVGTSALVTSNSWQKLTKRERNHLKSLRRKQRKKERWLQRQLEENEQSWKLTSSEDEDREGYTCAVCLDVYFSPYMCHPCLHVFCEPCLRTLAKNRPGSTPCPLCRTLISNVLFQKELSQTTKTSFPKEYLSRKQTLQRTNYAKWPLPSCPKRFRIFGGYQRHGAPGGRWQFPPRAFGLDALDLLDGQGWPFDLGLVIISIYSVHWCLAFIIFCILCYFCLS